MEAFFQMISTFVTCGTIFMILFVISLSLPKSRLRTVLSECLGYAMMAFCAFYCVSPVDVLPEAVLGPFGYIDDVGAVYGGYLAWQSARQARRQRQIEFSDN
jgi:uncharacterized membrane protein YkvA (DUF1232 family)